jgi:hypothetical protein
VRGPAAVDRHDKDQRTFKDHLAFDLFVSHDGPQMNAPLLSWHGSQPIELEIEMVVLRHSHQILVA